MTEITQKLSGLILLTALIICAVPGSRWLTSRPDAEKIVPGQDSSASLSRDHQDLKAKVSASYGQWPLSFEVNRGQTDSQVRYLSRGHNYSLFLTPDEAVLALRSGKEATDVAVLRMGLIGANGSPIVTGQDELPGKSNYLLGGNPRDWKIDIPNYRKVNYANVYPGVDLVYYGNQRQLEYDLILTPGADPQIIRLGFVGADRLELDNQGNLLLSVGATRVVQKKPVAYQEVAGIKHYVAADYVALGNGEVGFKLGDYDRDNTLIIDPVVSYSTYLGGRAADFGSSIAVDSTGNAYITGTTFSIDFPVMNQVQSQAAVPDAFVTKINAAGNGFIYTTYLGGNADDEARDIAVDANGNAYLTGLTTSSNFPIMNPFNGGENQKCGCAIPDAFVTRLNANGNGLIYSTYLGGTPALNFTGGSDTGNSIAVDNTGIAYVTGRTNSVGTTDQNNTTDFPLRNPFQDMNKGGDDIFYAQLNTNGGSASLIYSTFLGGSGFDQANSIAIDAAGNAYITGETTSPSFPGTTTTLRARDAFVTKFNAQGSALIYSRYLGGSAEDRGFGIAVDAAGNAYVTGSTGSNIDFPKVNAKQSAYGGGNSDAFVTKINTSGDGLLYSTFLGGSLFDFGEDIAVDAAGSAYVTGGTGSTNFPVENAFQPGCGMPNSPCYDAFVTKFNTTGNAFVYSSFLGGSNDDGPNDQNERNRFAAGIAVDAAGNVYVTGMTSSNDFPTKNPIQTDLEGIDAFITKIVPETLVQFSSASYTVNESGPNATITVTRTGDLNDTVTVDFATSNGTATAASDYTATAGTLTFAAGVTSLSFNVPILNDNLNEANETVNLTLSNPTGDTGLGNPHTALLTIIDNDLMPSISISDTTVTEGNTGTTTAIFTVNLSAASSQTVMVDFATANGTASAGSDYTANAGTLTFSSGTTTQTISILVNSDVVVEPDETFFVNLTNPTNAAIADGQGTGTIFNDDLPALSINDVSVTEGDAGPVNAIFTVTLSAASIQDVTVRFATADITATAGSDYESANNTLFFPAGITSRTINVAVIGDTLNELNETFKVILSAPTNAVISDSEGIGTITDNDVVPSLSINDVTVKEGNSGTTTAIFTVTLSAASGRTVSVSFATANNSAMAGSDYNAASGTISFAPGELTKMIALTVIGDTVVEANETLFVNLSTPMNATISDGQGLGTITNDDVNNCPTITISPTTLLDGVVGVDYGPTTITASGGRAPYTYSVSIGKLPTGLTLNSNTGMITGTPTVTGTFFFTITATDANGCMGSRNYSIRIKEF